MPTPRILFVHLPKCAGRSVNRAIIEALKKRGVDDVGFVQIHAQQTARAARVAGLPLYDLRDRVLSDLMARPATRFARGHVRVSQTVFDRFADRFAFVTLMRDPVEQFVSQYYFDRYKESDHARTEIDLASFLATQRAREMGAHYVRALAGDRCWQEDPAGDVAFQAALENLQRFAVVGVVEALPAFARSLREAVGLDVKIPHVNRSPRPEGMLEQELTNAVRERIRALCAPNRRLYERVAVGIPPGGNAP